MDLSHTSNRTRRKRPVLVLEHNQIASTIGATEISKGALDELPHILERMRLEKALLASQLRIQELEKDRDQTKCDIHDGVLQSLYAVGLGLKSCALLLHDAPSRVTEQLKRSTVQLDQALRELRSFLNNGHAKELDGEEDLDRALPALVQAMTGLSSVHCRLTIDPAAIACIPKEQQKDILNFIREALSNCIRHAQATTVQVSLTFKDGGPCLQISDDGIGFMPHNPPKPGLGLRSLAARATGLGARIDIASRPWRGTRIGLKLPRQGT
jgi:signal transduction histidine kinase